MGLFMFFSFLMVLIFTACDGGGSTDSGGDSDGDGDSDSDSDFDAEVTDCEGGRHDAATGLCWQDPKAPGEDGYSWQEAFDYCEALELGGYTNWVLPTRQNFIDMLGNCDDDVLSGGHGYCDSCFESDTCGELFGSDTDWYWSLSPYNDDDAWFAEFGLGLVHRIDVESVSSVRCVRTGP